MNYFMDTNPNIISNNKLRTPQIEAYIKIKEYFTENIKGEALIVLPTGTGKSGLISIAPYGVSNGRVLIITPGLVTKKSVIKTLHPLEDNFWLNYDVLFDPEDIPVVEEYDSEMLKSSLEKCNFVIANVHKLYKNNPKSLLNAVDPDFFDMIIIDEAHHSVANTWQDALLYFKDAKKLHVTGTPYRGDFKELPGELIHTTKLSDVMALKYVKWLSKMTVNCSELYFTVPGIVGKLTKEEVLEFKEREWIERSVALSKDCSLDVINESINRLKTLREASVKVPHKILAVACSISHADDVAVWYQQHGLRVVIVHSGVENSILEKRLQIIEDNDCDVVVSVNMLMEGYDHKYLTVLALFRPYKSLNAFAQIIGRVLRAIPDNEITDFAIDNSAIVIYHEETGMDSLWESFAKEVIKSKYIPVKEYDISDREYKKREILYADINTGESFISSRDSYLPDIDFNDMFESARRKIDEEINRKIEKMRAAGIFAEEEVCVVLEALKKREIASEKNAINDLLLSKRPEQTRKVIKSILYTNANEAAQDILAEKGIDPKGVSLYNKFKKFIPALTTKTANDGILVWYINDRVRRRYGPVNSREPETLRLSEKYMNEIIDELRRMI